MMQFNQSPPVFFLKFTAQFAAAFFGGVFHGLKSRGTVGIGLGPGEGRQGLSNEREIEEPPHRILMTTALEDLNFVGAPAKTGAVQQVGRSRKIPPISR